MSRRRRCVVCGGPIVQTARAPERKTCTDACRQAEYRRRRSAAVWPADFETAEDALIELRRQRLIEPEVALARIVAAWQVAA